FNVKNFDLLHLDRWNSEFRKRDADRREEWRRAGVEDPQPFEVLSLFAPQAKGLATPVPTGGRSTGVKPYSCALADVIEQGLFKFLFAEEDIQTANLGGLVGEVEEWLTSGTPERPRLRTTDGAPQTFQQLLDWFKAIKTSGGLFDDFMAGTKGS